MPGSLWYGLERSPTTLKHQPVAAAARDMFALGDRFGPDDVSEAATVAAEHRAEFQAMGADMEATDAVVEAQPAVTFGTHATLGHAARARGDRAASLAHFRDALGLAPRHPGALTECGTDLLALGRLDEAEAAFNDALAEQPVMFGALAGLGHVARARNDRLAALAAFEAAATAYPDNADLAFEVAAELSALGRLAEAGEIYERFSATARPDFSALVSLGHLARRRGDRPAALARFSEALALRPRHVGLLMEIALDLAELGDVAAAEARLREVLAIEPAAAPALIRLGQLARRRGDRVAALAHFNGAVTADPANIPARLEIAAELRDAQRVAEARAIAASVLAEAPDDLGALMFLAHLERLAGNRAAALEGFRAALAQHPDDVGALVECAIEERVNGFPEASARLLQRARALAPDNLHALMQCAEHAWLADDPAGALAICEAAIKAHPLHPAPYVQAARGLSLLGRDEEGLDVLAAGIRHCGPHAEVVAKRAGLLRRLGRWEDARALLRDHPEAATHFGLWREQVELDLALGAFAACERALAAAPPRTTHEQADVAQLRGELAAARWDVPGSIAHLTEAVRLNPANGWSYWLLARAALLRADLPAARRYLEESVRLDTAAVRLRRLSPNVTQSLLGQILDEYAADGELIGRLQALDKPGAAVPIGPCIALVRDFPGKTAAAVALMLALRRAGALTVAGDAVNGQPLGRIPRRIAQYWDQPEPPPDVAALMAEWPVRHPDYAYARFSDREAQAFLKQTFQPAVLGAYRRAYPAAQKADIFRLAWLYAEGGVYVDADDRCLAPVTGLLAGGATMVAYHEEYGTLGNNFLAVAPQHPVIGRALREAVGSVARGDQDIAWLSTGPGLLTRAFAETLADERLLPAAWLAGVVVIERHELRRVCVPHAATAYKQTGQHWVRGSFAARAAKADSPA